VIATLPMYDWPSLGAATDAFWAGIRDRLRAEGIAAPDSLDRGIGLWTAWESPDLLLSQSCGMPYRTRLHGRVTLVATPDYGLPGVPRGWYNSVLVVRKGDASGVGDYRARCLAYNGQDSQSGWAAPQNHAAELGFRFTHTLHTGAHRDSALAVSQGQADIAAIDAVTWRILQAEQPDLAATLSEIARTRPTPGLPLITAAGRDPAPLARAAAAAIAGLAPADCRALGLEGLVTVAAADYLAVPTPAPPSQDAVRN
jgi:ABC-type phosphate/phosphonate transport system substrate-binding protein